MIHDGVYLQFLYNAHLLLSTAIKDVYKLNSILILYY